MFSFFYSIFFIFQHENLIWKELMPEWTLQMLMQKFGFNRIDALNHINKQNLYCVYNDIIIWLNVWEQKYLLLLLYWERWSIKNASKSLMAFLDEIVTANKKWYILSWRCPDFLCNLWIEKIDFKIE